MINEIIKLFLKIKTQEFFRKNVNVYKSQEETLMNYIKENKDTEFGKKYNFAEIKNDTHGQEWQRAFNDSCHIMNNIAIAKEGGADDSIIDYLMDTLALEEVLG